MSSVHRTTLLTAARALAWIDDLQLPRGGQRTRPVPAIQRCAFQTRTALTAHLSFNQLSVGPRSDDPAVRARAELHRRNILAAVRARVSPHARGAARFAPVANEPRRLYETASTRWQARRPGCSYARRRSTALRLRTRAESSKSFGSRVLGMASWDGSLSSKQGRIGHTGHGRA
jgi:hypothetical protein